MYRFWQILVLHIILEAQFSALNTNPIISKFDIDRDIYIYIKSINKFDDLYDFFSRKLHLPWSFPACSSGSLEKKNPKIILF